MKTFKQLREATTVKKDENPEAAALKPRAQGEQDFVDAHTVDSTDYPVKGTSAKLNADSATKTMHQPANGDRAPLKQGTSDLKDQSGFKGNKTPLTRADKTQGDMKPVKTAASSVTIPAFQESVFVNVPMISESDEDSIFIELLNGDTVEINEDTYNAIVDVFEQLNTGNREMFRAAINENADTFEQILDFVVETLQGDE
jgi:hypothetical protein